MCDKYLTVTLLHIFFLFQKDLKRKKLFIVNNFKVKFPKKKVPK